MDGGLKEKKMNINIEIKGQQAHIVNQQSLISGTSNLEEIKFDFSSEWNGYTKTVVIYVDDYSISDSVKMLVEKDVVSAEKLPDWLFREECELYIGVFGDNSEGRRITSTIVCQKVKKGVPVDVVNEITPDIYNQIIKIMCDTRALVKEADEKIEVNKGYLEQAEQKANEASESAMRAENSESNINATVNAFNDMSETKKIELINAADAKMTDINTLADAKIKDLDSVSGEKSNDIATLTTAKMEDIANVTNAKLGDINNTAQAQIVSINEVSYQNTKSGTDAVNKAAQGKIYSINETAQGQINGITETAQGKIKDINNTAASQINAINNTAISQLSAINKTAQSQIKNMTIKYSDMCRTLGIEHEGIMLANTSYNSNESGSIPPDIYSIDVSKFKDIEFGKLVIADTYEYTLPAYPISIFLTNLKDDPAPEKVTTGKRYDVSLLNDLQFYVSYIGSGGYETTVNYKLYNKLEETTE